jgi:DNA modification methylase
MEEGRFFVVAGERRLRAVNAIAKAGGGISYMNEQLDPGFIPVALYEELTDPEKIKEVELQENAIRADLTWQEHAKAVADLHELRLMKNPQHTMTDTVEELTGKRTNSTYFVRDELLLAKNLDRPEVAKARTRADAVKALKSSLIGEFNSMLGTCYNGIEEGDFKVKEEDAAQSMATVLSYSEPFDVILTDPPYGINADEFSMEVNAISDRSSGGQHIISHQYKDDWQTALILYQALAYDGLKITKPQAHLYCFCDLQHFMKIREVFEIAGWDVWPRPLIWAKDIGSLPRPHHGPKRQYECILYALKGGKLVTALYSDVIVCPAVKDKKHAAQKPVDLYVNLLRRSCIAGDRVFDPFCGSGTIFAAAKQLQLKAVGTDSDPACIAMSMEVIQSL